MTTPKICIGSAPYFHSLSLSGRPTYCGPALLPPRSGAWQAAPLTWVFWLCVAVADLIVGFLLGFPLISKYLLSRNEAAMEKGQELRAKLVKIQAPLGLFAIVMGALYLGWLYVL